MKLKNYVLATLYAFVLAEITGFSLNLLKFQQEYLPLGFYLRSWDVHLWLFLLCVFLAFLFFTLARKGGQDSLIKARKNFHFIAILANAFNASLIGFLLINSQVVERLGIFTQLIVVILFCLICISAHLIFFRRPISV